MNFQDLYKKIKQLDEQEVPMTEPAPAATDAPPPEASAAPAPEAPTGDVPVEECGGDMMPHAPSMPKQSDSVTMSVSMNGSGKGGIRDLLNVLKDIEGGVGTDDDKALFGKATSVDMKDEPIMGDNYANSVEGGSDPEVYGIDAVTGTGDDLHSKGGEAEKVNGGGNPMNVDEALVSRLTDMYNQIKGKDTDVEEGMWDTVAQGAKAAVQGVQNLGQQAVQGVQNAANTVANTTVGDAAKAVGNVALKAAQATPLGKIATAMPGVAQSAVQGAQNLGQQVAGAAQQVGQKVANAVAPKPAGGFDTMPDNMTMANPTGAAPTTAAPQLGQAAQAAATKLAGKPGMANAFESAEMTDIRKLAGL